MKTRVINFHEKVTEVSDYLKYGKRSLGVWKEYQFAPIFPQYQ